MSIDDSAGSMRKLMEAVEDTLLEDSSACYSCGGDGSDDEGKVCGACDGSGEKTDYDFKKKKVQEDEVGYDDQYEVIMSSIEHLASQVLEFEKRNGNVDANSLISEFLKLTGRAEWLT